MAMNSSWVNFSPEFLSMIVESLLTNKNIIISGIFNIDYKRIVMEQKHLYTKSQRDILRSIMEGLLEG